MANLTQYHLTYHRDISKWVLFEPGAQHCTEVYTGLTKEQAVQSAARKLNGSGASLRIHNLNGQFEEERTYPRSADPRRSVG